MVSPFTVQLVYDQGLDDASRKARARGEPGNLVAAVIDTRTLTSHLVDLDAAGRPNGRDAAICGAEVFTTNLTIEPADHCWVYLDT